MDFVRIKKTALYVCICFLIFAGVLGLTPPSAFADSTVKLQVSVGLDGVYKDTGLVPLQVTITNSGDDTEGELTLEADGHERLSATYYQSISIGKGMTKKITMMVPGQNLNSGDTVSFNQNGKELAKSSVSGRQYSDDAFFVGVLATDKDTANFMTSLQKDLDIGPVSMLSLTQEDIPTTQASLQMMDMLVINNFATDQFSPEQVQAIKDWTSQGGILILAGGSHYDKAGKQFTDISPVVVNGTTTVSSLSSLELVTKRKPVIMQQPVTVSNASLREGKVLYKEGTVPLIATCDQKKGKVVYVAYDLAEEPMASWSGNGNLWAEIMRKVKIESLFNKEKDFPGRYWSLADDADSIPTLEAPDIMWLAIFFAGYALLAGPILFYILRGKKRRIYIWGIVPFLSVLMCLFIYLYGIMQRGTDVLINNVSIVELDGTGLADVVTSTAFFAPQNGDYDLRVKDKEYLLPMNDGRYDESTLVRDTWVNLSPNQARIQYKNVELWSIRNAMSKKVITDAGKLESNLVYQNGMLVGTVTNKTKFPLRDVKLINGRNVQDLGIMAPGATTKVNVNFDTTIRPNRNSFQFRQALLPLSLQQEKKVRKTREYSLLEFLENHEERIDFSKKSVHIMAWTEDPLQDLEIQGESSKRFDLALVMSDQEIKPSPNGYVFYPGGTFEAVKTASTGNIQDESENGYHMEAGDITFDFDIAKETQKIAISKIQLYTWSEDRTTFEKKVYNWKTKALDPYDKAFENSTLQGEKLKQYISPEGKLRLMFSHQHPDARHIGRPEISVEGKLVK